MLRYLCPLPFLVALAACAPGPDAAATRLDPRDADYRTLRVFVTLPEGMAPAPGYPRMTMRTRAGSAPERVVAAALVPVEDPRETQGLRAYALPPAEAARLADLGALAREAAAPGSSALELAVETCGQPGRPGGPLAIALAGPSDPRPLYLLRPGAPVPDAIRARLDATTPCA